jgi:phosphopantothenoylcysteine decarboxylase/phosphopantothenate--cysteine ligase
MSHCIVTAGPAYEPLDRVRRLTNFSTGSLGVELANFLAANGHQVTLLIGELATYGGERRAQEVEIFSSATDLEQKLARLAKRKSAAVFHAAAVSDFGFGKIWRRLPSGHLTEISSGKISTRDGSLLVELMPTPKILAGLRSLYSNAKIFGWKYEVDGAHADVIRAAEAQLTDCRTDACVANGPAYGEGFGLVTGPGRCAHLPDKNTLFEALEKSLDPD